MTCMTRQRVNQLKTLGCKCLRCAVYNRDSESVSSTSLRFCTTVNKSELFLNAGLRFPSWLWCQNSTFNFNMGSCSSTIVASNVSNVGSLDHESLADVLAAVENLIKKLH